MKHLGDITQIDWSKVEPVDVVTGGSPCQDLSVAGKRAGLAGERSGLYIEQIRCIKELRNADRLRGRADELVRPRYMVWENVVGAFSSNKGADFAAVLTEAIRIAEPKAPDVPVPAEGWHYSGYIYDELGRWSVAWRTHDAQFWGVPQRRRRISLVCDFGGLTAGEILFKPESLRGHSEASGEEGKEAAGGAGEGTAMAVHGISPFASNCMKSANPHSGIYKAETSRSLDLNGGNPACNQGGMMVVEKSVSSLTPWDYQSHRVYDVNGTFPALHSGETSGQCQQAILEDTAYALRMRSGCDGGGKGALIQKDKSGTLGTGNDQTIFCKEPPLIEMTSTKNTIVEDGICPTLTARMGTGGNQVNAVLSMAFREFGYGTYSTGVGTLRAAGGHYGGGSETLNVTPAYGVDCRNATENAEMTASLQSSSCHNLNSGNVVRDVMAVRRLTPLECERLQGFPDGWTDIGEWTDSKGKKHKAADSPRYKALGNSIALPFWHWLLGNISAQYDYTPTLGSLFDGIGGFPLCWEDINGKGTARWASEIEEFPIAVTKLRFGEE